MRKSGILMHISSLPSEFGIGKLGDSAYMFANFLRDCGVQVWQILPLSPTSYGDSPYQSFSVHAGNPYFIDFQRLEKQGYLAPPDYEDIVWGEDPRRVDYARVYNYCFHVLRTAFSRFRKEDKAYLEFCEAQKYWLPDYALFMALKDAHDGKPWYQWEKPLAMREPKALEKAKETYAEQISFYTVLQFWFYQQWGQLKAYCNQNGISIVGDIPIYVAYDSVDVWVNPELFLLDKTRTPIDVAGCPPDVFSPTGQLWGNPLYDWKYHQKTGFAWWIQRLKSASTLYNTVRIDHFRGFESFYAIPYGKKTAEVGEWRKGPGMALFQAVKEALGDLSIIAEDLGFVTPEVRKLLEDSGYPGMKVLQFAFDSTGEGDFLPHRFKSPNCICYTGTHDNDTTRGWFSSLREECRNKVLAYTCTKEPENLSFGLIRTCMASIASYSIFPLQDVLNLGSDARMNFPGKASGNWNWRFKSGVLTDALAKELKELSILYGRYYQ